MHINDELGDIQHIRILQIAPLAAGWWGTEWDRCPGMALLEFVDHNGKVFQDILPLSEDLQVKYPDSDNDSTEWGYVTSVFGDNKDFLTFRPTEDYEHTER